MSNFEFRDELRKLRLLITSQWIWIKKNPTVHLHYFIHRVRQNCQTNHFPILRQRFLVSFFKILNLKNRWFDDVTWLLSTNFMKDRQGECLGKISHPHRVWKVSKHRFSENTELAIGRTSTLLWLIFIFSFIPLQAHVRDECRNSIMSCPNGCSANTLSRNQVRNKKMIFFCQCIFYKDGQIANRS